MASSQSLADQVRERAAALQRFADWEAAHPSRVPPAVALESIGAIYQLLPSSDRRRQVDPTGVMALHKTLSRLRR